MNKLISNKEYGKKMFDNAGSSNEQQFGSFYLSRLLGFKAYIPPYISTTISLLSIKIGVACTTFRLLIFPELKIQTLFKPAMFWGLICLLSLYL